jgi:hypothetical protein
MCRNGLYGPGLHWGRLGYLLDIWIADYLIIWISYICAVDIWIYAGYLLWISGYPAGRPCGYLQCHARQAIQMQSPMLIAAWMEI